MSDLLSLNPPDGHPMSVADENRLQERLEARALLELESVDMEFVDWVSDQVSAIQNALIIRNLAYGTENSCSSAKLSAESIRDDYIQWRTSDPRFIEDVQQLMAREDGEDE